MMSDNLFAPRYCSNCGGELKYDQVIEGGKQIGTSVVCSGCGEGSTSFSDSLSPEKMVRLMFPDNDFHSSSEISAMISAMTPPPPPPIPTQFLTLSQEFESYGVTAIVTAAHFPLFALKGLEERFFPDDLSYAGGRPGDPLQHLLSGFTLTYAGPSYEHIAERIIIEQEDAEALDNEAAMIQAERFDFISDQADQQEPSSIADLSSEIEASRIVWFLERLSGVEAPELPSLAEGRSINRYVNRIAVRQTPAVSVQIRHESGAVINWMIRRLNAPLPIVHARAQIDNTRIEVGAIGAAGNDIEKILGHLVTLIPESELTGRLNEGWKTRRKSWQ